LDTIASFLAKFGEINGLLILGIIFMFWWVRSLTARIHRQHQEQLQDRQREIDRLADDNHAYRDRFLALLDKKFQQEEDTP
jgi:Mg2+ and Co2+ transporter CorA